VHYCSDLTEEFRNREPMGLIKAVCFAQTQRVLREKVKKVEFLQKSERSPLDWFIRYGPSSTNFALRTVHRTGPTGFAMGFNAVLPPK
jgi:hypothetical protein